MCVYTHAHIYFIKINDQIKNKKNTLKLNLFFFSNLFLRDSLTVKLLPIYVGVCMNGAARALLNSFWTPSFRAT